MKRLFSLLLLALLVRSAAADGLPPERRNVVIELQIVTLPQELGLPLVAELLEEKTADAAYDKIQKLLLAGKAQLIGWPVLTLQGGQRGVVEAIDEIRYATEYVPATTETTAPPPAADADAAKAAREALLTKVTSEPPPAAFETRNAGVTLEVEPVISPDGKTIVLTLQPQHVRLNGFLPATIKRRAENKEETITVEQPRFDVTKVSTALAVRSGQRVLAGLFHVSTPPNQLEFFLLKAEVKPVE